MDRQQVIDKAWAQIEPKISPHFSKRSPYGVAMWEAAQASIKAEIGRAFDAGEWSARVEEE